MDKELMKIKDLYGNPRVGSTYSVPCVILEELLYDKDTRQYDEFSDYCYLDIFERDEKVYKRVYIPIIDHPHSDIENGQNYLHYHVDFRFIPPFMDKGVYEQKYQMKTFQKVLSNSINSRINSTDLNNNFKIVNKELRCFRNTQHTITPINFIKKSKITHKCIHKGKCPHRGYDLNNTTPDKNGIITCPLHGLKFDAITKKILTR